MTELIRLAHVPAVIIGGPAAGSEREVPIIAGTWPRFLGLDGGNYIRDGTETEQAVYRWWPIGATEPVEPAG